MKVQAADIAAYHDYSVEWLGSDIVFRLDGREVYRIKGQDHIFSEPLFAILHFVKINDAPLIVNLWTMEVDWVKHEVWAGN